MKLKTEKVLSKTIAVKICGMKEADNILEIASLKPAYLGFIFARNSPRYFEGNMPKLPKSIQKVGVFVAETMETILEMVDKYDLQAVQLHGNESVFFCQELKEQLPTSVSIIKVFAVGTDFDFEILKPFEDCCDYYLLDTKGKFPGGNGTQFDWKILERYSSQKPFFLSGGIGVEDVSAVQKLMESRLPLDAIDCNSKLEFRAGIKNKEQCKQLLEYFN
ncbi:phosphoribosylanthranilate isomerase [Flavobacterium sp.]|jgi:phosphoribosylanthranilate isomerase|uniref:phosphoribosylanthranilate isomerase n=1 Tax=Flavobacterium sp. TaxID=239 RepID=UPI0037C09524